jgi:hypothetical protein
MHREESGASGELRKEGLNRWHIELVSDVTNCMKTFLIISRRVTVPLVRKSEGKSERLPRKSHCSAIRGFALNAREDALLSPMATPMIAQSVKRD